MSGIRYLKISTQDKHKIAAGSVAQKLFHFIFLINMFFYWTEIGKAKFGSTD